MEKLGKYYGIKQSEMIAVGDGFNDLSMIEYAGLGVAMANSPEEVKEKADYITLSNEEDGVAHVIHEFISK
jgi:hydroxymethylpyrimidine pyrophosphatase-like HAD family hydrolase